MPNFSPNLIQSIFNGVRIFEFKRPKIKKIIESNNDQTLISFSFKIGHKAISKKMKQNTTPKLLF